ncbi:Bax inhibitor-1/YccA family protein [Mucilaginibacter sp.]|jgi:FtsH-binding integral membrane protein|uniref:Bax inhibitor-1/YccA family protein n=1 Tax=Mucilaginibacter sp. TaxID=1882438 RepID=UPI002B94F56F|nr:Bax inhibitor-1/YccA family protein [Mucilaginibacter sp.]HTI58698.1 Bax inhibitor-1/YccA family protein [Mucilaginibacter sp.]
MEHQNPDYTYQNVIQIEDADQSRKFIANVFMWMFVALGISSASAYIFATPQFFSLLVDQSTHQLSGLFYVIMFAPLAFVLIMNFGMNRISYGVLAVLYVVYAAVTGVSLSVILLAYTASSVIGVFLTSSAVFGIMAIAGYTTKTDLTKFGSLMMMGLIGVVIASVINIFLRSDSLGYLISYIGVAVFVGLTAYDVQKLKNIGAGLQYGEASAKKMALMGGLTLYLDFINLFLFLLRIFGRRR